MPLALTLLRALLSPGSGAPCAARQQCHLGALSRIGKSAKIRYSAHIFTLLQYHWVYAAQENFLKLELPAVLSQLLALL